MGVGPCERLPPTTTTTTTTMTNRSGARFEEERRHVIRPGVGDYFPVVVARQPIGAQIFSGSEVSDQRPVVPGDDTAADSGRVTFGVDAVLR